MAKLFRIYHRIVRCIIVTMKNTLSALILTQNSEETIRATLESIKKIADEVVIVDGYSKDKTIEIVHKVYKVNKVCKVYKKKFTEIGKQRQYGLKKCTGSWVLILDSDEIISSQLREEIRLKIKNEKLKIEENAFWVPFQSYYLGKLLEHGGERYHQLRLFRREALKILPSLIHNKFEIVNNKIGYLRKRIIHHSYRSLKQIFNKFTDYGIRMAKEKYYAKEKSSLKKIIFYPLHMFWARFIKDKGYKDGMFRIPLDIGFMYMEWLIYISLFIFNRKKLKIKNEK